MSVVQIIHITLVFLYDSSQNCCMQLKRVGDACRTNVDDELIHARDGGLAGVHPLAVY